MDHPFSGATRRSRVRRWRLVAGSVYGAGALLSMFGLFRLIVDTTLSLFTLVVGGTGLGGVILGFVLIVLGRLSHPAPNERSSTNEGDRRSGHPAPG